MEDICKCNRDGEPICARNISIFSELSDHELRNIISLVNKREYMKGEVLCIEGEICENLFLIREGQIKLSKMTVDGKEQIIHILNKGEFFGETNLFDNRLVGFTATAMNGAKICSLSRENLEQIIRKNPSIAIKILKVLSCRLSETEDLAKVLATKDVEVRIANMLLEFSIKYGENIDGYTHIKLPLNREDMANYCGITRETISRKLSKFESNNIIELKGNKIIIIKDINKLKSIQ